MDDDSAGFIIGFIIGITVAVLVVMDTNTNADAMYKRFKVGEEYCATHGGIQSYDWNSWECKDGIEISGEKSK